METDYEQLIPLLGSASRSCAYGTWKKKSVLRNTVISAELEDAGPFIWNETEGIFEQQ